MGLARLGFEMFARVFSTSVGGELIPHSGWRFTRTGALISGIDTEPRCFSLVPATPLALLEQLDHRVVHEDGLRLKDVISDAICHAL